MTPFSSIVVGVDFTPSSAVALGQAIRIGAWSAAKLHVVHVIDTRVVSTLEEELSPLQREIRQGLINQAREAWEQFAQQIEGKGAADLPIDISINNRIEGILHRAQTNAADLLVLGAFGTQPAEVGIGTVASACVQRSTSDVLLVRDTQSGAFRTIVAAVDFSTTSLRGVERAAAMAARDGAAFHVLHVFRTPRQVLPYRQPVQNEPHLEQQHTETLKDRLIEFCQPAIEAAGLSSDVHHVVFDHPTHRSGIVQYARSVSAELIVLGTRGRSGVRGLLLGSSAERALRHTTCSVLAVKPQA